MSAGQHIGSHVQIDRLYANTSGREALLRDYSRNTQEFGASPIIHNVISPVAAQLSSNPSALVTSGIINGTPVISSDQQVNGRDTIKIDATHSAGVRYVEWTGGPEIAAIPVVTTPDAGIYRRPYKFKHSNEIACDIYVADLSGVSTITLQFTMKEGAGTSLWTLSVTKANGDIKQGWNKIRFAVNHGTSTGWYEAEPEIQKVRLQFTLTSNDSAGAGSIFYLDRIYMIERPKASIIFVTDFAVRWFLDGTDQYGAPSGGYPDLKARGLPCVFASQPGYWRDGDVANDDPTYIRPKASEMLDVYNDGNGNEISYHSYANEQSGGASAISDADFYSCNQMALNTIRKAGIRMFPWRAAILQNTSVAMANNPQLLAGQLYACATGTGDASVILWPPRNRQNIPRTAIHNRSDATIDNIFRILKAQRAVEVHYTHYVSNDGTPVNMQVPNWEYYLNHVDTGISEGWLEVVTMEHLFRRSGGRFVESEAGSWWEWTDVDGSIKQIPGS